jgi:hypothetical protein
MSQITENRKVEARKPLIFQYPIFGFCLQKATLRQNQRYPVDVAFVIRQRLAELDYEQRDLARASAVTESYISQLLTRKKAPPAPNRTDIY